MPENSPTVGFRLLLTALSPVALDSSNRDTRAEDSNPSVTIERSLGSIQIELFPVEIAPSEGYQHLPVQPAIVETANLVSES